MTKHELHRNFGDVTPTITKPDLPRMGLPAAGWKARWLVIWKARKLTVLPLESRRRGNLEGRALEVECEQQARR